MPKNPWPGGAVSLILLPDGEIGHEILKQAVAWTRSGLLSPALWTQPSMVNASDNTKLSVISTIPGHRFSEQGDAIQIIANTEMKLIRLIALRTLFPPGGAGLEIHEADKEQLRALEELSILLQTSLPDYPDSVRKDGDVKLSKINLIAAPPWAKLIADPDIIQPEWHWNVMLSLENRLTPFSTDAILRPNQEFIGAVLSNTATVAGIWQGVPRSSLELIQKEASSSHDQLWIHRSFVRGVIKEGVVTQVTADVLRKVSDPNFDVYDSVEGITPIDVLPVSENKIDAYVEFMIDSTLSLQNSVMRYEVPQQFNDPTKIKIGFLRQLKEFFSFSWDKLRLLPLLIFKAIVESFNRFVNRVFQGKDGRSEIDVKEDITPLKNDKRDMGVFSGIQNLNETVEKFKLEKSMRRKTIINQKLPSAELWKSIRQLTFASLDGSDAPGEIRLPRVEADNKPVVLRRVSDVFFDPDSIWSSTNDRLANLSLEVITWEDLEQAFLNKGKLQKELTIVQAQRLEIEGILQSNSWEGDNE